MCKPSPQMIIQATGATRLKSCLLKSPCECPWALFSVLFIASSSLVFFCIQPKLKSISNAPILKLKVLTFILVLISAVKSTDWCDFTYPNVCKLSIAVVVSSFSFNFAEVYFWKIAPILFGSSNLPSFSLSKSSWIFRRYKTNRYRTWWKGLSTRTGARSSSADPP